MKLWRMKTNVLYRVDNTFNRKLELSAFGVLFDYSKNRLFEKNPTC